MHEQDNLFILKCYMLTNMVTSYIRLLEFILHVYCFQMIFNNKIFIPKQQEFGEIH